MLPRPPIIIIIIIIISIIIVVVVVVTDGEEILLMWEGVVTNGSSEWSTGTRAELCGGCHKEFL